MKKAVAVAMCGLLAMMAIPVNAQPYPEVDLIADGGDEFLVVGNITYGELNTTDGYYFVIIVFLYGEWQLNETHIHVTNGSDGNPIPQTRKGNPKVGRFEYKNDTHYLYPEEQGMMLMINVTEKGWQEGDTLQIAVHAEIWNDTAMREESGWCNGTKFNEKRSWAMYFEYTVGDYVFEVPGFAFIPFVGAVAIALFIIRRKKEDIL